MLLSQIPTPGTRCHHLAHKQQFSPPPPLHMGLGIQLSTVSFNSCSSCVLLSSPPTFFSRLVGLARRTSPCRDLSAFDPTVRSATRFASPSSKFHSMSVSNANRNRDCCRSITPQQCILQRVNLASSLISPLCQFRECSAANVSWQRRSPYIQDWGESRYPHRPFHPSCELWTRVVRTCVCRCSRRY
jgi:hypothetical protein